MADPGTDGESWFYCLTCERVWHATTWRHSDGACPSSLDKSWPEIHPNVGWSQIRERVGEVMPAEGRRLTLVPIALEPDLPEAG